jgi:hypothetical protein
MAVGAIDTGATGNRVHPSKRRGETMSSELRNQIRAKITSSPATKAKSVVITFFGAEVELRQATLKSILEARGDDLDDAEARTNRSVMMLVDNMYVPGTDERVFDEADVDFIKGLPMGGDLAKAMEVMTQMTQVNFQEPKPNSDATHIELQ